MATVEKYKPNRKGLKALLGSEGVRVDLHRRAEAVAEVARTDYEVRPPHQGQVEVVVDSQAGTVAHPRARAAVIAKHPGALGIEADRRPLGKALDAARD